VRGNAVFAYMVSSSDFDGCGKIPTPLRFIPLRNDDNIFYPDPDSNDVACSSQKAKLIITKVGNTYTFTIDNSEVTKTISSQTIRWKYLDGSSDWTVGTVVTNPTGKFLVQLQTKIAGCPDSYDTKTVYPCGNNLPAFLLSYRYDTALSQHCVTVDLGGLLTDTINTGLTTYTKKVITGITEVVSSYTLGTEYCTNADKICFNGSIKFNNTCDPVDIELCYDLNDPPKKCSDNRPLAVCESVGNGAFILNLGGSWVSDLGIYFFETRPIGGDNNSWKVWDYHEPLFAGQFEARVWMTFCDSCPPVCSEITSCVEAMAFVERIKTLNQNTIYSYMDNDYSWNWNNLPVEEKKKVKEAFERQDYAYIMVTHMEYKLSSFSYCCSKHIAGVKYWVNKAIEDGII